MALNDNNKRLRELGGSNYEIVDGQPDIRGWTVKDSNGKKLGEVDELLFDTQAHKVRYLLLDMHDNECNLKEREVLIPIGLAELHEKDDHVLLHHVNIGQLAALPEYVDEDIDYEAEATIHRTLSDANAIASPGTSNSDLYSQEYYNNNLYRNRSTVSTNEEYIRMRQEPSFLESEGTTRREIDDDVDEMREESINIEERDAIPVSTSISMRSGNDIDEWDVTDENMPPPTNTDVPRDQPSGKDKGNRPSSL